MAFELDQSETLEGTGGQWCKKPGTYHVIVNELDENAATKDGRPIDGLKMSAEILDGTEKDQIGKTIEETFYRPDPGSNDKGEFAKLKLTKLFLALGLIKEHQPGKRVAIDPQDGIGRQIVLRVDNRKNKNTDKIYLSLDGASVFHVDDLEVKDIPKSKDALALIPPEQRKSTKKPAAALVDC